MDQQHLCPDHTPHVWLCGVRLVGPESTHGQQVADKGESMSNKHNQISMGSAPMMAPSQQCDSSPRKASTMKALLCLDAEHP